MKKKKSNFLCILLSILMCVVMIPSSVADAITVTTKSGQQINQNGDQIKGTEDGYSYELWNQDNAGTATMTLGEGGAYSCVWSNIENVLFRRGVDFDCTKTYKELGNISVEYEAEYNNPTQNTYLCVYGWTRNPLIEYYIVDSWGSWRPPGATAKGQINVDGGTYDVYVTDRINQPSIDGNTTFKQYWSVRTSKRTSGTISVSTHFAEWEKMGMETGKLYEAALNVEGYQSSGTANVTKNIVKVGGEIQEPDPVKPVKPDENGYYYHSTFENGTDDWDSRGDATVATASQKAYKGSKCLSVTGRTDSWNGTARSIPVAAFAPGKSYSFSTMVMQDSTASEDFNLTLQYDVAGETNYANVAKATGAKGKWVQLANTSYTIPEGASNLLLYVETADSTTNFFVDEAIGAVDGTVIKEETEPEKGDINGDGKVNATDIVAIQNYLVKKTSSVENADIDGDGKVNVFDLVMLKRIVLGSSSNDNPGEDNPGEDNPAVDTAAYMEKVRNSLTLDVPSSATSSSADNYGTLKSISYYSSTAEKYKKANVLLPDGYSENEKYPVMYVNHGIMGDENSLLDSSMKIRAMAGNLVASGEAEKMIIVFTAMYTSKTSDVCSGITLEETKKYDAFLDDLTKDLMPYMEKNFSIKTGRENTAITGFSMGGREALYIGVSRPDLFAYIGGACPAPGITPGKDMFMEHPGCMQESEFKISNPSYNPYVLMITGGTNDSVVGTFPQSYHNILTTNGQDHIWQEIPGGGHDASCVVPHMYNFIKSAFKAGKSSSSGNNNNSTDGYFKSTFETSNDGWVSRGGTTLQTNSSNYYSGSNSLLVSGRESSWQGAAYELDPKTYIAGKSYSFSAAVMQASGLDEVIKMTLQYTDTSGETAYSQIASETVSSGKWTKLENTSYTIPAGATDLLIYIETEESTTNFYIDEASGVADGTASAIVTGGGVVTATPPAGGVDIS